MEVSTEAKRIMVVALGKLYSSRTQRGGLRLHRSLLLTLVMKSARDIYHAAQTTTETAEEEERQPSEVEMTTQASGGTQELQGLTSSPHLAADVDVRSRSQNQMDATPCGPQQLTRKRRGKATAEPDFLPCKKAKLECGPPQQLIVTSVLVDYSNCSSELGPSPSPIPLQTVIAAC